VTHRDRCSATIDDDPAGTLDRFTDLGTTRKLPEVWPFPPQGGVRDTLPEVKNVQSPFGLKPILNPRYAPAAR